MPRESAPHAMGPMHGSVAYPVVMMTMMLDSEKDLCVIAAVWAPSQRAGWSTHAWLSRQSHEDTVCTARSSVRGDRRCISVPHL